VAPDSVPPEVFAIWSEKVPSPEQMINDEGLPVALTITCADVPRKKNNKASIPANRYKINIVNVELDAFNFFKMGLPEQYPGKNPLKVKVFFQFVSITGITFF
jgi:hypothetical protein